MEKRQIITYIVLLILAAGAITLLPKVPQEQQAPSTPITTPSPSVLSASLALSPSTGTYVVPGSTISVNINLNTLGNDIDGVDIRYLNYNTSLLQIVDQEPGTPGTQIAAGSLMGVTILNSVNTSTGRIEFSQVTAGSGVTFNGSGVLATAVFNVLAAGTAQLTFDFSAGSTSDTNMASGGDDILSGVQNASFTLVTESTKFSINDRVETTAVLNVRATPSSTGTLVGTVSQGALGTVIGGPVLADSFWWWEVDYDSGLQGWSVEDFLVDDTTAATRSNGLPSGILPTGTTSTTISMTTNEPATCRYATTAGISYSSMSNTFTTTGNTTHSRLITGLTNGSTYNYYTRCQDLAGNNNTSDYLISFSVASPSPDTTDPTVPTGLSATAPQYNQVNLTWNASTDPVVGGQTTSGLAGYRIYRGTTPVEIGVSSSTSFTDNTVGGSTTYTYRVSAYDAAGNESNLSTSVSVTTPAAPPSSVSNVTFGVSLERHPNVNSVGMNVRIYDQGTTNQRYTDTRNPSGGQLNYASISVPPGTYDILLSTPYYLDRLRTVTLANGTTFTFPTLPAGDLNDDGIINSPDFSLMSPTWFTNNSITDINKDSIVNSIDYSIMNGNWFSTADTP